MTKSLMLTAAAALIAGAAYVTPASAVQLPGAPAAEQTKLTELVQYDIRRCRSVRNFCARRWGVHSWHYERCRSNRGC